MNFARTNLSLLLARQNRQHAALPRLGASRDRAALWASPARGPAAQVAAQVAAPVAAPASSRSQALELVGAIAMMAAFMVLALFG